MIARPLDALPLPGKLEYLEALEAHVGGNGPNTAGALGRLGAAVSVCGRVGSDLFGGFLIQQLQGWGVDTGRVKRDPTAPTSATLVAVDSAGERRFLHQLGANARFCAEDVLGDGLEGIAHLHLASCFILPSLDGPPAAGLLKIAQAHGIRTSLDVCWDRDGRWLDLLSPLLPFVDWMLPSEEEAACLTGETCPSRMAARLQELGCREVVIKRGAQGCYYAGSQGQADVNAFDVPVVDTTGAGDCFIAGLLFALSREWELDEALRFANGCGARSVMALGAVSAMGPAEEIRAWTSGLPLRAG
jgi:sugar/nucleoside kinase (ribokinase family)